MNLNKGGSIMHAAVKILFGLLIIIVGFGLFVDSVYGNAWTGISINWWQNFKVVLTGVIPPLLILIGIFVVWLEADELKAGKELGEEFKASDEDVKKAVVPKKRATKKRE
jgi:chromate transport protein ChrA